MIKFPALGHPLSALRATSPEGGSKKYFSVVIAREHSDRGNPTEKVRGKCYALYSDGSPRLRSR